MDVNMTVSKGNKIIVDIVNGENVYPRDREFLHEFIKAVSDNGYTLVNKNKILRDIDKFILLFEDVDKVVLKKLNSPLFLIESYSSLTLVRVAHGNLLKLHGVDVDRIMILILDVLKGDITDINKSALNRLLCNDILDSDITEIQSFLLIDSYESTEQIRELKSSILK